jgi:hypothetical protein
MCSPGYLKPESTYRSHLHWLFSLRDGDLVTVFLKDVHSTSSELVAIGFGEHLLVVSLEVALVLDLALLDDADIHVGA